MSDELIQIPSYLTNRTTIITASNAACSWCSEISCETSGMGYCESGCQTASESPCDYNNEGTCRTACEGVCQSACQSSCQSACQISNQQPTPTGSGTMTAVAIGDTSITVGFSTIAYATQYEVVWRLAHTSEGGTGTGWTLLGSKTVTSSPCDIDGLSANTKYAVNYKGVNSYGSGSFMASPLLVTTTANGSAYIYDGDGWKLATVYIHNGSTWVQATPQVHDGTQFLP